MTVAHLAPHVALLAALTVATVLVLREGRRGRTQPGHGQWRPHSQSVGTAQHDRDAIKEHDMTNPKITQLYADSASPDSIRAELKKARTTRDRWSRHVDGLARLLDTRLAQVEVGTWPPTTEEPTR